MHSFFLIYRIKKIVSLLSLWFYIIEKKTELDWIAMIGNGVDIWTPTGTGVSAPELIAFCIFNSLLCIKLCWLCTFPLFYYLTSNLCPFSCFLNKTYISFLFLSLSESHHCAESAPNWIFTSASVDAAALQDVCAAFANVD